MPSFADALFENSDGTTLAIEVTAGARVDLFPAGFNEWRRTIACRVVAPATGGKANRAVITLISESLEVPTAAVTIIGGTTSSQKKVFLKGISKTQIMERLLSLQDKNRPG
jgi:hypothetical protein